MAHLHTNPGRRRRAALAAAAALLLCALLGAVWSFRLPLATRLLRAVLAREGLADLSFELTALTPGRAVLEAVRLGDPEVLAVGRAEARYAPAELRRGRLDALRLSGVRLGAVADGRALASPLADRLEALRAGRRAAGPPPAGAAPAWSVAQFALSDARLLVRSASGDELALLTLEAGLTAEPGAAPGPQPRSRFWAELREAGGSVARAAGHVEPARGAWEASGEVRLARVEELVARARLLAPDAVARLPATPRELTLTLRGSASGTNWTRLARFEAAADAGRGCAFTLQQADGEIRLQALRAEAAGTPEAFQVRLSGGVAGVRVGERLALDQGERRLLGVRGAADLARQPGGPWRARATLEAELPGRATEGLSAGLWAGLTELLSDGGSARLRAEVEQAEGGWRGEVEARAEARRTGAALPAGRVGAGRVVIEAAAPVAGSRLGAVRAEARVEEAYGYRPGLAARGSGVLRLRAEPPYETAAGDFEARLAERGALAALGVRLEEGALAVTGEVAVAGLLARRPDVRVSVACAAAPLASAASSPVAWRAVAAGSGRLEVVGGAASFAGEVSLREVAASAGASGAVGRVEAGLGALRVRAAAEVPGLSLASNASARASLAVEGGWLRAAVARVELAGLAAGAEAAWTSAGGLRVVGAPRLAWERLEADGLRLRPEPLELEADDEGGVARGGLRVEGSALRVTAEARWPWRAPDAVAVALAVPEAAVPEDDALLRRLRELAPGAQVSGRVAAEARVVLLGRQPRAEGSLRLSDGAFRRRAVEVSGVAAEVPFVWQGDFRTIGEPVATFITARAGNVRLERGRAAFQVSPEAFVLERAEVGWCKGTLNAYSVRLDPRRPKADVVVYADRIDAGEALMMVMPFKGRAEGVLYGRFPLGIEGGRVKLSTGFLYSLPGQGGRLRLDDAAPMAALLERAGIRGEVQRPLSAALSDMDFDAIRLDLEPKAAGDAVLRIKLKGRSNYAEWPAPVDLNLNVHGPLERLVNVGLDLSKE